MRPPRRLPSRYALQRYPRRLPRHALFGDRLVWRSDLGAETDGGHQQKSDSSNEGGWKSKVLENVGTTLGSVVILGLAGYAYHHYYKYNVLKKIENAFEPGYSSAELTALGRHSVNEGAQSGWWVQRDEQKLLDDIIAGREKGQYWLIHGEKGVGKTSMLLQAMRNVNGEGVALLEAHGDPEVFRVRLGKALDFEYHEDYIGSLFSFKGPRDTTALLDIERAFNKLEKVALERQRAGGRPLVLIINGIHLLRDDEDGKDLMELIQQRAEVWAASNLVTFVLNSDDYWVTERLNLLATRMKILTIPDIPKAKAIDALRDYRGRFHQEQASDLVLEEVYKKIGGRLRFLSQVAKADNMLSMCDELCRKEKTWLLNQCWILGEEMDDDVMDSQKFCAGAFVLAAALADAEKEAGDSEHLPQIALHDVRQLMGRSDFVQGLDHLNIIAIDSHAMVRADSVPMQNAFREIVDKPGFREHLQATLDRLDDLESLQRTRELTLKDLWSDGEYSLSMKDAHGREAGSISLKKKDAEEKK